MFDLLTIQRRTSDQARVPRVSARAVEVILLLFFFGTALLGLAALVLYGVYRR